MSQFNVQVQEITDGFSGKRCLIGRVAITFIRGNERGTIERPAISRFFTKGDDREVWVKKEFFDFVAKTMLEIDFQSTTVRRKLPKRKK